MKAKDFQIGDFIKFRQEIFLTDQDGVETTQDIVYEIGKICALNNIGNVWVNDSEGQEYQITVDEIEPIPLTPEILEKNEYSYNEIRRAWEVIPNDGFGICKDSTKFAFTNLSISNISICRILVLSAILLLRISSFGTFI